MWWSMSATTLELPVVRAELAPASTPAPTAAAPAGRLRFRAVLAPLLPTLLLVGLCIAGLSDPPAASAEAPGDRGGESRLHVPTEAPYVPVPLTR
jgi:hypothetical protein